MGRFLNADAFTSTGQGILGNNMFTYCGNNPVMFKDEYGTHLSASISVVYVNDAGDEVWYRPIDNTPPSEFAKRQDELFWEFSQAPHSFLMGRKWFVTAKGWGEIGYGIFLILTGIALVAAPIPTTADERKGFVSINAGIALIWDGIQELTCSVED